MGWTAQCPAHDDKKPSLSISASDDGKVLLRCHAGCSFAEILGALNLAPSDVLPSNGQPYVTAVYDYRDETGKLLYQVVRYDPKGFRQRWPKAGGGWEWKTKGTRLVPYRLQELLAADPAATVLIVEGEKDVDNCYAHNLVATCNVGGAGKWRCEYAEFQRGRKVGVIADKDDAGREHAQEVAASHQGIATSAKLVEVPRGKDVSDYFAAGGTVEELVKLVESAPLWEPPAADPAVSNPAGSKEPPSPEAIEAAKRMATSPDLVQIIADDLATSGIVGERDLALTIYLAGMSRLLNNPLSAIVRGPTSSGKSYIVTKAAQMFPPDQVIRATKMTPQALFYAETDLSHKFIIGGERSRLHDDAAAEATSALRQLQSEGRITKLVTKRQEGGRFCSRLVEKDGPIAYIETTTLTDPEIFVEDLNRVLLLRTDESEAQTRAVINHAARSYNAEVPPADVTYRIIEKHRVFQRMLKRCCVSIPFAEKLVAALPARKVETRRIANQVLGAVEAVALLHQFQRERNEQGRLVATLDDYEVTRRLLLRPLAEALPLKANAVALHKKLAAKFPQERTFSTTEAQDAATEGRSAVQIKLSEHDPKSVRGWLNDLLDYRCIEQVQAARGRLPAMWKLTGRHPEDSILPPAKELS
jgi:hypothetical protein